MKKNIKWTDFLWLSLITFAFFMLELLSFGVIEPILFQSLYAGNTVLQKSLHSIITAILWCIAIFLIIRFSERKYNFYIKEEEIKEIIGFKGWSLTGVCLICCKIITFIDWNTLKVIGEFQKKEFTQFICQYVYYFFEVALVLLIMIYAQKAFEVLLKRRSKIPFGGLILASTWGAFHFISTGIDFWNGFSCMIFAVLSGIIYITLKRKVSFAYIVIAIGYLL